MDTYVNDINALRTRNFQRGEAMSVLDDFFTHLNSYPTRILENIDGTPEVIDIPINNIGDTMIAVLDIIDQLEENNFTRHIRREVLRFSAFAIIISRNEA